MYQWLCLEGVALQIGRLAQLSGLERLRSCPSSLDDVNLMRLLKLTECPGVRFFNHSSSSMDDVSALNCIVVEHADTVYV